MVDDGPWFYVQVDDLQEYLNKAQELGGKKLAPPVEIPTGSFAWLSDPDGNIIGLWKLKSSGQKAESGEQIGRARLR